MKRIVLKEVELDCFKTKQSYSETIYSDYFNYMESQVAADGGCERDVLHTMNEGFVEREERAEQQRIVDKFKEVSI